LHARPTILVVGPDDALQRSVSFALEAEGFSVVTTSRWPLNDDAGLPAIACAVVDERALSDGMWLADGILPDWPVVLLSDGFAAPWISARHTLVKPLLGSQLVEAVAECVVSGGSTYNPVRS
jgi:hypothetical protein